MIERFQSEITTVEALARSVARPFVPLVGNVDWRFGREYLTTENDIKTISKRARVGDIILTHTNYNLSNVGIPGFWKHAAFVTGNGYIIEAVRTGVRKRPAGSLIAGCDYYLLLSPRFADTARRTKAAGFAESIIGFPYDKDFRFTISNNVEFFCSESIWWSYEKTYDQPGQYSPFTPKKVLGVYTIVPQDFANAYWRWEFKASNRLDKVPHNNVMRG